MRFHMHGDVALSSYMKGCAVHTTYSRAATIHATNRQGLLSPAAASLLCFSPVLTS
jgi:hypothetical protein